MRPSRFAATLLAGLLTASCSDAASGDTMTAEETVAFILFGVKGGVNLRERTEEYAVNRTSASPLALELTASGKKFAFIHVEKRDDCRYNATIEFNNPRSGKVENFSAAYDLSGLKSAMLDDNGVALETVDVACPWGDCPSNDARFLARGGLYPLNTADKKTVQANLTAAVEGFRKNICTGGQ